MLEGLLDHEVGLEVLTSPASGSELSEASTGRLFHG